MPIPLVFVVIACLVLIPRPIDFISNTILVILDISLATLKRIIVIHHTGIEQNLLSLHIWTAEIIIIHN